ncbi:MAG: preprotein translocase subunit SecA [Deltaproteobacteria bacterium]|nr:preprotein translocase subunit SecA [Deltaproteobacteria bacterium]
MQRVLSKIFGTSNDRAIKRLLPLVEQVNVLEGAQSKLSDADLRGLTTRYRERLENGEPLDDLLPEAFATVREAAKRTLGQRHYDVQVIGGIMLHQGRIAEMKTGEGKTLVATLPSYLNGLTGRGVHVVTVNDFLASRDAEWMGQLHRFLGLEVGAILHGQNDAQKQAAYAADVTYCTNNELGFDYLRDNMKFNVESCVQRDLHFAIVDEVDSILIDEARTPLIISGPSEQNTQIYTIANRLIPSLQMGSAAEPAKGIEETGDFWIDEKAHSATFTDEGMAKVEKMLRVDNLYDPQMLPVLHAMQQALMAHTLKRVDVDYVVRAGDDGSKEVVIVDEHTGRLMPGRRWADGLHQAVEAKEGIQVRSESQTFASITFQNYFRMYDKLGGMTGTADTEAEEFAKIYNLDVSLIPTNRPLLRNDEADVVFKTKKEKFDATVEELQAHHEAGQPVLVGTISIETSEMLSKKLKRSGIKHTVLNAKQHEKEAEIVAQAGRKGAITISTNMAGRGTDILLGGNPEVMALEKCQHDKNHPDFEATLAKFEAQCAAERQEVLAAGGLHILGTERHESRRIDNQLRGRSGRQGDPGSSQFFLSLEDDLLRIFEADRVKQWWDRVGVEEGEAIENRMLTRVIEGAQKKVEGRNFDIRKHLLDYDNVMNKQRHAFYARRLAAMTSDDKAVDEEVQACVEGFVADLLGRIWPQRGEPEDDQYVEMAHALEAQFGVAFSIEEEPFRTADGKRHPESDALGHAILARIESALDEKREEGRVLAEETYADLEGYPTFQKIMRDLQLQILDQQWKAHLHTMDSLRGGINMRAYAQRDPKLEYQREGFALFGEMEQRIDETLAEYALKFSFPRPDLGPKATQRRVDGNPGQEAPKPQSQGGAAPLTPAAAAGASAGPVAGTAAGSAPGDKVGRNDPCPCGSGKKYKKCHG